MGDSGIVGDVLTAAAAPFMPVPVTVVKGYVPPDYVGTGSLVLAVSFSGDTEETRRGGHGRLRGGRGPGRGVRRRRARPAVG